MGLQDQFIKEAKQQLKERITKDAEKAVKYRHRKSDLTVTRQNIIKAFEERYGSSYNITISSLLNVFETAYLKENLEHRVGKVEDKFYQKVMEEE